MSFFALQSRESRAEFMYQFAIPASIPAYIVEKDFWVCWLLGRIFETPALGEHCVFKGGTSLSKVFKAINRFSEDIDLGISPGSLGWKEADLDEAPSVSQRRKRMEQLGADCAEAVRTRYLPALEAVVLSSLRPRPEGGEWLTYQMDETAHSPILYFAFPQAVTPGTYIAPSVKIEFGSLTDQRPTGTHPISPFVADLAPMAFEDFRAEVVALELERTFWEKATILHAEYHRPPERPFRDRFARHYSDFAALWGIPLGQDAAKRLDLLDRDRLHMILFFASSWANYDSAKPGSLRLSPHLNRAGEL